MKKIYLGLAIHNHQPVGNFPWVFEEAFFKAYLPFIEALERHPQIRLSLHYSGPLIDWFKENQPDFLRRIASLVGKGQVEIVGGAYYEPILPIIPDADKQGQIEMARKIFAQEFGTQFTGFWLAERVWEPHLTRNLVQAGIQWTLTDDNHFLLSGLKEEELFGYYLTEEEGYWLKVFPSLKALRYLIPWEKVKDVMDFLKSWASEKPAIAVMGDDGEKFGIWPGTYKHCYERGWIEEFFQAIEKNSGWLHTIPLGEYIQRFKPLGLIYLPNASYPEMMEWALPPERALAFRKAKELLEAQGEHYLGGGFWRFFLVKYPEANLIHKKMLWVHKKVYQALPLADGRKELWKGQCNCPYWHGIFGGLYLPDIRSATYQHLIKAERIAEEAIHPQKPWQKMTKGDFDGDGEEEIIIETDTQSLYLSPAKGGSLFEWDVKGYNLLSTLSRHKEAYHLFLLQKGAEVPEEEVHTIHKGLKIKEGIMPKIIWDRYLRFSLIDHILPLETTLEGFSQGEYEEIEELPFCYYFAEAKEKGIRLWYQGKNLFIEKAINIENDRIGVEYRLTNLKETELKGLFGSEWNINLLAGGNNPLAYYEAGGKKFHPGEKAEIFELDRLIMGNRGMGIRLILSLSQSSRWWLFPIETLSSSEAGIERVYQGSCLLPLIHLSLSPGESFSFSLTWKIL